MMIYAKQAAECDEPWKLWEVNVRNEWEILVEHPHWSENREYRQIPKTIRIGNFYVPEPMREKPEIGTRYWYIVTGNDSMTGWNDWAEDPLDNILLKRGICHTTKEAAIAHAKALFSFSEVG